MTATKPASSAGTPSRRDHGSRVIDAVRRILRALEVHSSRLEDKHGITGSQLMCLRAIVDSEATTATAISRQVRLSTSTVAGILDRLEAKGMIERTRDHRDRRVVNVAASRQGRQLADRVPSLLHRLAGSLGEQAAGEREELTGALETVAARLDGMIEKAGRQRSGQSEKRGR